jgi:hypothetical protein
MENSFVLGISDDLLMAGGSGGTQDAFLRNHETFGFDLNDWRDHITSLPALQDFGEKKQVDLITLAEEQRGYK